jgi:hypothetical protein
VAPQEPGTIVKAMASIAVLSAVLAGCAGRIWLDRQSPDGISLHWYTREASIDTAQATAQEHCRGFGKEAILVEDFEDQDITRARFACR